MSTRTAHDHEHLRSVAENMNWALLAAVMKALNWQWYHIKDRTPNAGEIRDEALSRLGTLITEARQSGQHCATLRTGGLEYVVNTCDETGDVLCLYCAFVLESWDTTSPDRTTYRFTSHD